MTRLGFLLFTIFWSIGLGAQTDTGDLTDLFRAGRFAEASDYLLRHPVDEDSPADLFWKYCLTTDPEQAETIYHELISSHDPEAIRLGQLLYPDLAWLRFSHAPPDSILSLLLIAELGAKGMAAAEQGDPPGRNTLFLQGLALKSSGRIAAAREAFAQAILSDPSDCWSGLQLSRLAASAGDLQTALLHLRNILHTRGSACRANALALQWKLIVGSDPKQAKAIEQQLLQDYPKSFAHATISVAAAERERLLTALEVDINSLLADSLLREDPGSIRGTYSLALAEFSDRGRALAFVETWQDSLRGLVISRGRRDRGQMRYKISGGSFQSRAQAAIYAESLQRKYELEIRIMDLDTGH